MPCVLRDDQRLNLTRSLFGATVVAAVVTGLSAGSAKAGKLTSCVSHSDLAIGEKIVNNTVCAGVGADTECRINHFLLSYDFGSVIDPPVQAGSITCTIFITDSKFELTTVGLDSGCIFPVLGGFGVTKNASRNAGSTSLVPSNGNPASVNYLFAAGATSLNIEDIFFSTGNSAVSTANNFFGRRLWSRIKASSTAV
jgi:hypothetical protein